MPLTTIFCIVGAISIAGFPLTSGFIAKTQTLGAAAESGLFWTWLIMIFASAGVMEHSGIKIPYFAFFAHDAGHRVKEAPFNMLIAMGLAAAACIGLGMFPDPLLAIMPFDAIKEPYTAENVITKAQLLTFAVLAFAVLVRTGLYVQEIPSTNLSVDWFYRVPGKWLAQRLAGAVAVSSEELAHLRQLAGREVIGHLYVVLGPQGLLARTWSIGFAVLLVILVLAANLLFNLLWSPAAQP
jgi:multicomponent Na+:H+ antiporter subunit D